MNSIKIIFSACISLIAVSCGDQRMEVIHINNAKVIKINIDKERFCREVKDSNEYQSIEQTIGQYVIITAINAGLALLHSNQGISYPITTEINLKNGKDMVNLNWGENVIIMNSPINKFYTLEISSPRYFSIKRVLNFEDNEYCSYDFSIKSGMIKIQNIEKVKALRNASVSK